MSFGPDLLLGSYSIAGVPPPQRYAAAVAAGFEGASVIWHEITARRAAGETLAAMNAELRDAHIAAPQLEIIRLPGRAGLSGFAAEARDIAETAAALGCVVVQAAALDPTASYDDLVEGFGLLSQACAKEGLCCGIEFVPFLTGVPDLEGAVRLVHAVSQSNAGVVVDSLHFFRSGEPWDALADLKPGEVVAIQVNDGPTARPTEDYRAEAMGLRQLPGDGQFDLTRFLDVLESHGAMVPLTAEVVSHELDALPPDEAARRMADSLRRLAAGRASAAT